MTERDVWYYLYELCKGPLYRKRYVLVGDDTPREGICEVIWTLKNNSIISDTVCKRMIKKIRIYADSINASRYNYLWPSNRKGFDERARFCRRQWKLMYQKQRKNSTRKKK
jgi:hypothetical protein